MATNIKQPGYLIVRLVIFAMSPSLLLKNVYKDPKTKHKIQLISPPLALGAAVHSVIEALSVIPAEQRFAESLIKKFDQEWQKFTGIKGGF